MIFCSCTNFAQGNPIITVTVHCFVFLRANYSYAITKQLICGKNACCYCITACVL